MRRYMLNGFYRIDWVKKKSFIQILRQHQRNLSRQNNIFQHIPSELPTMIRHTWASTCSSANTMGFDCWWTFARIAQFSHLYILMSPMWHIMIINTSIDNNGTGFNHISSNHWKWIGPFRFVSNKTVADSNIVQVNY